VAQAFPQEADRIADAWRRGDEAAAADHVTDEMVDTLAVAGEPESARQQLLAILDSSFVDRPIVSIPYLADDVTEKTVEALAPATLFN
jgi:alkanesulfonate monooxygenase SsuD/methylene tetrahydromethanopterin reductase-like flavin-dependent oxidoreductase (luciferase family)